ncbi:hypothetical protein Nepgr_031893 [Nepenthes gracilis]|uniref:Clathrin light chain n=1 Tax=Nepenthes gracilis TaxID=150966 RepID=A0AAD3THK6_NEPGR|nr:hypothetical protein Nepgr_031893 [Nepenthes gracilis]
MSTFTGSFGHAGDESQPTAPALDFDDDVYTGYDSGLASQGFESFANIAEVESATDSVVDSVPIFSTGEDAFSSQTVLESPPLPVFSGGSEPNGEGLHESNGPVLSPASDFPSDEGFALSEWRRLNAMRLAEKEKEEKVLLRQIIEEADEFKREFYRKRLIAIENRKASNREKEKQFMVSQEKFHAEAYKNYWKSISELIPHEVPTIEKRGKKEKEKQPSIVVIQGPKAGKPTEMSRMRHILVKLKHNPPPHMKPEVRKDAKPALPPPPPPTSAAPAEAAAATTT